MKRTAMAVLAAVAVPAATLGQAQGPDKPAETAWAQRPTLEQLWPLWPHDANRAPPNPSVRNTGLWATLDCAADADGTLSGCTVRTEARPGVGIGAAALKAAPLYRLPAGRAGRRTVLIEFTLETLDAPPSMPAKPPGEAMLGAWPATARQAGASGVGAFSCISGVDGRLRDCVELYETPAGSGFAKAAMSLSDRYYQTPATRGGQPAETVLTVAMEFGPALLAHADGGVCSQARPSGVPCHADVDQVRGWVAANVNLRGEPAGRIWNVVGATPEGAVLAASDVGQAAPGVATVAMRLERFEPLQDDGGAKFYSESIELKADCASGKVQSTSWAIFTARDLKGTRTPLPADTAMRAPDAEASEPTVARQICSAIRAPSNAFALPLAQGGGYIQMLAPVRIGGR